jgi:hypothetical protein
MSFRTDNISGGTSRDGTHNRPTSEVLRATFRPVREDEATETFQQQGVPAFESQEQYQQAMRARDENGRKRYEHDPLWRAFVAARLSVSPW